MPKIISIDDKLLAKLPARELAARLMNLPARRRLEIILERDDAEEVIASMAEQDFYLAVKELGEQSAGPFLALARPEQLNLLLDIDCWHRDEIAPGRVLAQLEEIAVANGDKFISWLYQADFELLVLLFKKWLDVELITDEDEYHQAFDKDLPRLTLDDQYYFTIRYPEHEELIRSTLEYLFENHREFYLELMNHVITSLDAEMADLAYRFHRGRLEDHAISDFSEARTIYRPLRQERLPAAVKDSPGIPAEEAPTFALALIQEQSLLAAALSAVVEPGVRQTLQIELTTIANKIVMADELDPAAAEGLRHAAEKAGAYINLALEENAGTDIGKAAMILRGHYLEDLFRQAHGQITQVRGRLAAIRDHGWFSRWPYGLNLLDQEWFEPASLLLAGTPMILRQPVENGRSPVEDFIRTRADLQQAKDLVSMLEAMEPLFTEIEQAWHGDWDSLDLLLWRQGQIASLRTATLGTLLLTAAALQAADGKWRYQPLPVAAWKEIFPRLTPERLEAALNVHLRQLLADDACDLALNYLDPIFSRYRTETGSFGPKQLPAPSLVPFFLFTSRQTEPA